jgi:ankyrin repeat protein
MSFVDDFFGITPLMMALIQKRDDIVDVFLQQDAETVEKLLVDRDAEGRTALMHATSSADNLDLIRRVLTAWNPEEQLKARDVNDEIPLIYAIRYSLIDIHLEVIGLFLDTWNAKDHIVSVDKVGTSVLMNAADTNFDAFHAIFNRLTPDEQLEQFRYNNKNGDTLFVCAVRGLSNVLSVNVVRLLIDKFSDDITDTDKRNALAEVLRLKRIAPQNGVDKEEINDIDECIRVLSRHLM